MIIFPVWPQLSQKIPSFFILIKFKIFKIISKRIEQILGQKSIGNGFKALYLSFLLQAPSLVPLGQIEFENENDAIDLIFSLQTNFGSINRFDSFRMLPHSPIIHF